MKKVLLLYFVAILLVGAIGVWVPPFVRGFDFTDVCLSIGTFAVPTIVNTLIEKILLERKTMEFERLALYFAIIVLMPLLFTFEVLSTKNRALFYVFTSMLLLAVMYFLYKRSSDIFSSQSNDSAIGGPIK